MFRLLGITIAILSVAAGSLVTARWATAGGGGCHEPVTDGRGTNVDLKGNCMITTILRVDPGDTVTFTNRDEIDHTVTGAGARSGDGTTFGSFEPIPQGKSLSHTFPTNGVYVYYCIFHPGMVGAIVVGDGSGPGDASGNGAAPLGVNRRTTSDIAASRAASTGEARISDDTKRIAVFGGAALIAVGAAAVALTRRLSASTAERQRSP